MDFKEKKVYETIKGYANTNSLMQTVSGLFGFPVTLAVDGGAVVTHYLPMINNICNVYNFNKKDVSSFIPVIKGSFMVFLSDLVLDKVLGQIPLLGAVSNYVCAKIITWRIGLMFAYLAKNDMDVTAENVKKTVDCMKKKISMRKVTGFNPPTEYDVEHFLSIPTTDL